ncbi:MAG: hypothetical protein PUB87_09130 [Eubacteriaceae bacterium]|nr:hypothetical protein [Eubacteriaceae bacterium]
MKKILVLFCFLTAFSFAVPNYTFAGTEVLRDGREDDVKKLKSEICRVLKDGVISSDEQNQLEDSTSAETVEAFLCEKIDDAIEILNDESKNEELSSLENGETYKKEVIDLGDGCSLVVELSDEDTDEIANSNARATSGSNTLWKGYGSRYFTASTTVSFPLGSVTMKLRNYYILSSKGIDEDRGKGTLIFDCYGGTYSVSDPIITDSIARTVGASDVNMECKYTLKYDNIDDIPIKRVYKIESTVGFVDIDKSAEKIKVKQSWKLTRLT